MSTTTINLTLRSGVLKFKNTAGQWQTVDATNPSTGVNSGDEVDWVADSTISKIKIKPAKGDILDRVDKNDSPNPKGKVKTGLSGTLTQKYTISVKAASGGGGYLDFDPELNYPKIS